MKWSLMILALMGAKASAADEIAVRKGGLKLALEIGAAFPVALQPWMTAELCAEAGFAGERGEKFGLHALGVVCVSPVSGRVSGGPNVSFDIAVMRRDERLLTVGPFVELAVAGRHFEKFLFGAVARLEDERQPFVLSFFAAVGPAAPEEEDKKIGFTLVAGISVAGKIHLYNRPASAGP